jgi:hypothetical protein
MIEFSSYSSYPLITFLPFVQVRVVVYDLFRRVTVGLNNVKQANHQIAVQGNVGAYVQRSIKRREDQEDTKRNDIS